MTTSDQPNQSSGIPRRVTAFTAGCVLISNVIGTGIFTTTGFMARDLGDPYLILFLWLVGALLALAGAISYSELGAALPEAGGEYLYLRHAYGPFVAFLSGWASFIVGFGAGIAAAAESFTSYFLQAFPLVSPSSFVAESLALSLVWLITAVHTAGSGPGGFLQRVLTGLKVGLIGGLVLAAVAIGKGSLGNFEVTSPETEPTTSAAFVSLIFVMYAYSGWNVAGYLAGEIIDPGCNVPRTMIRGTLIVGVVYMILNLVYVYALPVTELAEAPVLPVAEKTSIALFGAGGGRLVSIMLCLSIAGSLSAMIWAGPRVYYAMARDRLAPALFAQVGSRSGAPERSILIQSAWATVLILSGTFEQLVVYSGFVLTIFSGLAVAGVIVLRWHRPDLHRPYRMRFYPLAPCFYLAISVLIVLYTMIERPQEAMWAAVTLLAGVPLYLLWQRYTSSNKRPESSEGPM